MQLCHQPRQRAEPDLGESEKPLLTLFNNHASMTIFEVGIHSVRLVGLCFCHPLFADGLGTHPVYPRVAGRPSPGVTIRLTDRPNEAFLVDILIILVF